MSKSKVQSESQLTISQCAGLSVDLFITIAWWLNSKSSAGVSLPEGMFITIAGSVPEGVSLPEGMFGLLPDEIFLYSLYYFRNFQKIG